VRISYYRPRTLHIADEPDGDCEVKEIHPTEILLVADAMRIRMP